MFILAETQAPLQSIPAINLALPLLGFLVALFVVTSFMGRRQRAAVARMSPEDRLKLVDSQWQKGPRLSRWIGMIFLLPLLVLPSFTGSLGQWLLPVFSGFIVLSVSGMFWEARASTKRSAAAGLPADYIAACKRQSIVSAALLTVFMVWLLFDLHRMLAPLQQNMAELERRLATPKEPAIREREIGQHPPDH